MFLPPGVRLVHGRVGLLRLDRRRVVQHGDLGRLHTVNVRPCPTTRCMAGTFSASVGRRFGSRSRPHVMSVTKHVVDHHIVNGTSFVRLRSSGKHVRICVAHSSLYPKRSGRVCGDMFGHLLSLNSFVKVRNFMFHARVNRVDVRTGGLAMLTGSVGPLPVMGCGSNITCSSFRSPRLHCHRHCMSLVIGRNMGRAFLGHTAVVEAVHTVLSRTKCARMRAPALRSVPNKTDTHPFVARRGSLSVSLCLHVTARLCLGQLVMNKFRNICRVKGGFHGRKVSGGRGPRFAYVRLCMRCGSCG